MYLLVLASIIVWLDYSEFSFLFDIYLYKLLIWEVCNHVYYVYIMYANYVNEIPNKLSFDKISVFDF